jgi:nucleoside-diphosphate-sugar epimerase
VQLSSTLTYGYALPDWAVDESWAARPPTPATQSLEYAERAARTYRRRLPLLVLRAAPTFGPRDEGAVQRLLTHFGRAARPRLAAAGRAPVSLVYGPDFARAVWAVLQAFDQTQGRILHVKSIDSDWRTIAAQARALGDRLGAAWPLPLWLARRLGQAGPAGRRLLDAPPSVPDYPDLIGRPHLIDDTPLRALTGFAPLFGLRAALHHSTALPSGPVPSDTAQSGAGRSDRTGPSDPEGPSSRE